MIDLKDYENIIQSFAKKGKLGLHYNKSETLTKQFEGCTALTSGFEVIIIQNKFVLLLGFKGYNRDGIWIRRTFEIENTDLFLNLMKQKLNS